MALLHLLTDNDLKELVPLLGERKRIQAALSKASTTQGEAIASENIRPVDNIDIHTDEPVAKKPKFSLSTDIASSSNISLNEISEIQNNSNDEIGSICMDDVILKSYDVINFDLKSLLNSHIMGRAILLKYDKEKSIANRDRNNLCDIIVCHFLNEGKRLNNATISILSDKIVEVFQGEKRSTYYVSPIGKKKSRNNKAEIARGKLIDKYRNKWTMLRKTMPISEKPKLEEKQDISREIQDSQIWLKHNSEPKHEVMRHWKESFPIRKIKHLSLNEFFEQWPILRTQIAIELVNYDFQQKFSHIKESFDISLKFETIFNYIYQKRKELLKPSDESLFNLLEDELTTDSKTALRLFLLSSLVPPRGRTSGSKTFWKPSVSEARNGLFIHVKSASDIECAKKERIDFMFKKGLTVQPYIIVVGPNLCNIHAFYVVIDHKNYQTSTLIDALLFCFQVYFVLDVKYTPESQHLWYLLQWEVFKITSEKDKQFPFLNDILQFCK